MKHVRCLMDLLELTPFCQLAFVFGRSCKVRHATSEHIWFLSLSLSRRIQHHKLPIHPTNHWDIGQALCYCMQWTWIWAFWSWFLQDWLTMDTTLYHMWSFSGNVCCNPWVGYRCSQSYWCGSIAGQEKLMCVSLGPHTTHVCKLPVPFYSGQHSFFQAHSDGKRCNQGLYAIVVGLERSIEFGPE